MAPIATLTVRLSAQIAEFQSEFREATKSAQKFQTEFEGIATKAAAIGTFLGTIAADIARSLARAFGEGIKDAVRLSTEFANAFLGLSSVAQAFGTDADAARDAANRLSADGLLPLKDSATGLKNLLAAGFNLDESTQLMNAFKDAAAFGRQGALSFGDAVRSATEGVKNGNSILVDNAGITKNLSQILKEAGFSAQDLARASSDAGVRQALLNGILKESAAFAGDANRLTRTYAGTLTAMRTQWDRLLATWGDAITQNAAVSKALQFVAQTFEDITGFLSDNKRGYELVTDALVLFVTTLGTAVQGISFLVKALNTIDSALVTTVRTFADATKSIADILLSVAAFTSQLPGGGAAVALYRDQLIALMATSQKVGSASQNLGDRFEESSQRSKALSGSLDGFAARLGVLAGDLELARGKTIEFGNAGERAGTQIGEGLAGGVDKAAKKIQDYIRSVSAPLDKPRSIGHGFGEDIGIPQLPKLAEFQFQLEEFWAETARINRAGAQDFSFVFRSLPGTEIHIPEPPKVPQTFWQKMFGDTKAIGVAMGQSILRAIQGGGNVFAAAAGSLGEGLTTKLATYLTAAKDVGGKAIGGFLGGAINAVLPAVGSLLGPLVGKITDVFAGLFNRNKGRDMVKEFAASFGGFDALQKRLQELGSEGERLWIKLTQGVGRNNPEQAAAAIKDVEAALDAFGTAAERAERRLAGLNTAIAGVNAKAELFAAPFRELADAAKDAEGEAFDTIQAKMAETAQRGQAEFERLGTFVAATFAGLVNETGDAIGAIQQLGPAFKVLQDGVNEFGLTSTGTIDQLLSLFGLVNDSVTGPILQNIQAVGQIFTGLQQSGYMTAELFQTVATDIGASFRDLEAKGGDVAQAMALSQPVLQALWEAQQRYGAVTDETTAKILAQAEEQGLVGDHMKDVNRQILDVLIAIADVFGAVLPESFRNAGRAAKDATRTIEDTLNDITIKPIEIDIKYKDPGFTPSREGGTTEIPALGSGGIVRRPTLALVGEAGPEAVVPLSRLHSIAGPETSSSTVILEMDGRQVAEATVPHIPGVVQRYGLV
jgi:phage-related protein